VDNSDFALKNFQKQGKTVENRGETGSPAPASSASQSCLRGFISRLARTDDISAGWADAPDTIRGRDGFTPDFGRGHYENLSGAISWLTFFAGGAADVRRSQSDWRPNRRERAAATGAALFRVSYRTTPVSTKDIAM
jgi:hypothetical protein